jgi:hypothetical protein
VLGVHGHTRITQAGTMEHFGEAFLIPGGNINILSCSKLIDNGFRIEIATTQDRLLVSMEGIETMEFFRGKGGFYSLIMSPYSSPKDTLEAGAAETISEGQKERTKKVIQLQASLGYPSDMYLESA